MEIKQLKHHEENQENDKLKEAKLQFDKLVEELNSRNLPDSTVEKINKIVEDLNSSTLAGKGFKRQLVKKQFNIIKFLEKEHKLVPINHYRKRWMAIGVIVFGFPIGAAFGAGLDKISFIGIGLPIGMVIGIAIGSNLDKKALDEGRQLKVELKGL